MGVEVVLVTLPRILQGLAGLPGGTAGMRWRGVGTWGIIPLQGKFNFDFLTFSLCLMPQSRRV